MDIEQIDQVEEDDKEALVAPFSLEEIKKAVFEMRNNKAQGPDGLPVEFYK